MTKINPVRVLHRVQDRLAMAGVRRKAAADLGEGVIFRGFAEIDRHPGSVISIAANVVLCSRTQDTALGVSRPVILRTLMAGAQIQISENTGLSGTVVCAAKRVAIGTNCLIGSEVIITDTDFHPIHGPEARRKAALPFPKDQDTVVIGNNVFIGARSIILKGAVVGNGSVVGAGSVVTGRFPERSIIAGNPARVIGSVKDAE